ncbi:hypothetical protein EDD85DRAFT_848864 [Armillaria nabsnona]|nr:hypothetical protein EDD85DRAFT_848864 [Armillaria nabsnona]
MSLQGCGPVVPYWDLVLAPTPPLFAETGSFSLDSLPTVNTSQQQETRTNMDSTAPFPPPPSGWISQSTRLDQIILATHEVLGSLPPILTRSTNPPRPKLSSRQKETFYVSSVEGPIFNIHKTFATPIIRPDSEAGLLRFLEREPWADMRPDKLVCLGCGCDVGTDSPWSWIYHRNLCEGIDNAILRSVVDVLEAEVAESRLIEEL